VIGDVAESWEWSPDRLTLTLKIRNDVRFHPIAPVNGRALDIDDVLFSWARLRRVGTIRSEFANDINPAAPITSITTPGARTVVIKLAEPVVYLLSMLAHPSALPMLPKEMDSQFDPKQQVISPGPFYLAEYKPSIGVTFKRHPNYHNKDFPIVDQLDMPLIPEYATGLAQFRSGAVYNYAVRPEDILTVKKEVPDLLLYQAEMGTIGDQTIFGWAGNSPFKDERVRQAYSMLMDRDLIIEVARNVSKFTSEGLPVETRWNSNLQCTFDGWWLDPQSKDFGPNAKYFVHNVPEAKKLMSAAGLAGGVDVISSHITTNEYGTDFPKMVEVVEGMMAEGGFRFRKNIVNYGSEFIPRYRDGKGNYEGLSYKRGPTPPADDAVAYLMFFNYSKGGVAFYGYDAAGKGDNSGDPKVDDLLLKARGEIDNAKRQALIYEVQRYLGGKQYNVRWAGGSNAFALTWPIVKNFMVYQGGAPLENWYWLDESLPPARKA
jgi:peptide/nickel transport system substrate-binding protein